MCRAISRWRHTKRSHALGAAFLHSGFCLRLSPRCLHARQDLRQASEVHCHDRTRDTRIQRRVPSDFFRGCRRLLGLGYRAASKTCLWQKTVTPVPNVLLPVVIPSPTTCSFRATVFCPSPGGTNRLQPDGFVISSDRAERTRRAQEFHYNHASVVIFHEVRNVCVSP